MCTDWIELTELQFCKKSKQSDRIANRTALLATKFDVVIYTCIMSGCTTNEPCNTNNTDRNRVTMKSVLNLTSNGPIRRRGDSNFAILYSPHIRLVHFPGIFIDCLLQISKESVSERILKIGQYLITLWQKLGGILFWLTMYKDVIFWRMVAGKITSLLKN